jgi:hypothetical protein
MAIDTGIRVAAILACAVSGVVGVTVGCACGLEESVLMVLHPNVAVGWLVGGLAGAIVGQVAINDNSSKYSLIACGALVIFILSFFVSCFVWRTLLSMTDI